MTDEAQPQAGEEYERDTKMLIIDEALPGIVEGLKKEGWDLIPGIPPVAIYHIARKVVREAPPQEEGQQLRVAIDDSKVHVLRNGKLV